MLIGYARVSTDDQTTAGQLDALNAAGVERIFEEKASGGRWDRPELHRMLDQLRPGDVVVVWKLDRLSRSLKDLLAILTRIDDAGAGFRSLTEAIDTTTPAGRMLAAMLGAVAQFERDLVKERTRVGLVAARKRGVRLGRPSKLSDKQKTEIIKNVRGGVWTQADAARLFNVSASTVSRILSKVE